MKHVRFAHNGAVHQGVFEDGKIYKGAVEYNPDDIMWLPPLDPNGVGRSIGVALGFAKHAKELKLDIPEYPLLFQKFPNTMIGHKANIIVPPGFNAPDCSAFSIICRAIRSLADCPGLKDSILAKMVGDKFLAIWFNLIRGVFPMVCKTLSKRLIAFV